MVCSFSVYGKAACWPLWRTEGRGRVMPSPVSGLLGRSARLHHLCPPLWSLFFYLTAQLLALTYSHKCIHSIPSSQLHSFIRPSLLPSFPHEYTHMFARSLFSHSFTLSNSFTHSAPLFSLAAASQAPESTRFLRS